MRLLHENLSRWRIDALIFAGSIIKETGVISIPKSLDSDFMLSSVNSNTRVLLVII